MKKFLYLFTFVALMPAYTLAFNTLEEAEDYASTHPEHPVADKPNPVNPDYTSFHRQQKEAEQKNILQKITSYFGIQNSPSILEMFSNPQR